MKRKLLTGLIATMFSASAYAQNTITLWTFDALYDNNSATGTIIPFIGTGTAATIGGASGAAFNGGYQGSTDNSGWQTTDYPATSINNKTAGTQYDVSTVGYRDLSISFLLRHSNTSANTIMVQYSTDGTTFNDYRLFTFVPQASGTGDTWYKRTVDFSAVHQLDNNPNAKFRVVTAFDTTALTYLAARSTSTYAGGTMRYDSVLIAAQGLFAAVPAVELSLSSNTAVETQGTVITITATAQNAVTGNQTVEVALTGAGITGTDYTLGTATITIPAGAVSASTTLTILNDGVTEGNETAIVTLANPSAGIVLGSVTSGSIIIADNDFPVLKIDADTIEGYETDTTEFLVKVIADAPVIGDQQITLAVSGANVTNSDYSMVASVTIPDGDTIGTTVFTVQHDAFYEGNATEQAMIKMVLAGPSANIGPDSTLAITIYNDLSNLPATVSADSLLTNPLIRIIDAQDTLAISGSLGDSTDPVRVHGIKFIINDPDNTGTVTWNINSSNTTVVPTSNITLTNVQDTFTLKINPAAAGFSIITLSVSDSRLLTNYVINYAASPMATDTGKSRYHTLSNEASTAIALDNDYMLVANDEDNILRVYNRNLSGAAVKEFDMSANLGLTDKADLESSARVGDRIFWVSSHSNSSSGGMQPNRRRIFAADIAGTGANTTLTYVGRYDSLRTDLVAWDVNNGHGLGANYYGFDSATLAGVGSEQINSNGFNIEGLVMAPNDTTAYICFRAPIVPPGNRQMALIVPVLNFTTLAVSNGPAGSAQFGAPIELDLGGRAIRSIDKNANNQYLIIAGPASASSPNLPTDFRLYGWMGTAADTAFELPLNFTAANTTGGSYESIVSVPDQLAGTINIQLLLDNGDTEWYGAPTSERSHMKFRSDWFTVSTANTPLPLSLTRFDVERCNDKACITWKNENESNIEKYTVERSEDGRAFAPVAHMAAKNKKGVNEYAASDPLNNVTAAKVYYRLKQVLLNGAVDYSIVKTLTLSQQAADITIAPNPASDVLTLTNVAGLERIELVNISGSVVNTVIPKNSSEVIYVKGLPSGIYSVRCVSANGVKAYKVNITH